MPSQLYEKYNKQMTKTFPREILKVTNTRTHLSKSEDPFVEETTPKTIKTLIYVLRQLCDSLLGGLT